MIKKKRVPLGYRAKRRTGVIAPLDLIYSTSKGGSWQEVRLTWVGKPVSQFNTVISPV